MTKRTENMSILKSSTRDKKDDIFRPTTPSLRNSFNQRKQTPHQLNKNDNGESMSNTFGTNVLSDSNKSMQRLKNITPRGQLKHSIGTSARRNDDDPETISERNAESLSREDEGDVENED